MQLVPAGVLTVSYLGTEMSSSIVDMQQGQAVDFEAIEGEHRQLLASIQSQAANRPAEPADQLILDLQVWRDCWCECMMGHTAGQCGRTAQKQASRHLGLSESSLRPSSTKRHRHVPSVTLNSITHISILSDAGWRPAWLQHSGKHAGILCRARLSWAISDKELASMARLMLCNAGASDAGPSRR